MKMESGLGMWICILGILGIVVGAGLYAANYYTTIGLGALGLGIILVIAGTALWMMKDRKSKGSMTPSAQSAQPTTTA